MTPVRLGGWSLDQLFLAQPGDFQGRQGDSGAGTSAPVTLRFTDAQGATARVLPTGYSVTDAAVRFEGESPELGRVTFDGRLDQGALATARRNLGRDSVVLTGTLTAGGRTVRNVGLTWWMGD